jgi:site-specific recombinase XerD
VAKKQEKIAEQEQQSKAPFRDMFLKYIERVKKDESEKSYTRKLGLFEKWINPILGDKGLEIIKAPDIETVKDNMISKGQSERSVQYAVSTITLVFKYASSIEAFDGIIPTSKVKTPKKDNKRERFLTKKEAEILLDTLKIASEQVHNMALCLCIAA